MLRGDGVVDYQGSRNEQRALLQNARLSTRRSLPAFWSFRPWHPSAPVYGQMHMYSHTVTYKYQRHAHSLRSVFAQENSGESTEIDSNRANIRCAPRVRGHLQLFRVLTLFCFLWLFDYISRCTRRVRVHCYWRCYRKSTRVVQVLPRGNFFLYPSSSAPHFGATPLLCFLFLPISELFVLGDRASFEQGLRRATTCSFSFFFHVRVIGLGLPRATSGRSGGYPFADGTPASR